MNISSFITFNFGHWPNVRWINNDLFSLDISVIFSSTKMCFRNQLDEIVNPEISQVYWHLAHQVGFVLLPILNVQG